MLNRHFVRSTDKDSVYSFGPKVSLKNYNLNETVTLTINEFVTPTIFFACESSNDLVLDRQINLLYESLSEPMRFSSLPQIGTTCVGRYSVDSRWYRARVVDRNSAAMTVDLLFLDYGNIDRSVPYKSLRKLEGTISTQFSSFMDCSKLNSQGALFGYVGAIAGESSVPWADSVKELEMKRYFEFQIISVPQKKSNMKNQHNTSIPFYLIRNNTFNKDVTADYSAYLFNKLKWEKCGIDESIRFLVRSFKVRSNHFRNIQLLLPHLLQDFNNDFNTKPASPHSIEDDNNDDGVACVTPPYSEGNESVTDEDGSSMSSLHYTRKKSDDEILIINDNDRVHDENNEVLVEEGNKDEYDHEDVEEDSALCSIAKWKITSLLVNSPTHSLKWHLPIPDEPTFKAIITTFNEKLEFHINICSEDITNTFKDMEKLLHKHYILCNDSMLKDYVTSNVEFSKGTVCLCSFKSTYFRCVIISISSSGDVTCRLIDFGDEITLPQSDFIPISDQFCQVPPLAIRCTLSGLDGVNKAKGEEELLRAQFHLTLEKVDYEVLVSLCLTDKVANFTRMNEKVIVEQPIPVEIFILQTVNEGDSVICSVNAMLSGMVQVDCGDNAELPKGEICLRYEYLDEVEEDLDDADDISGMKDIFINENLHQQSNLRYQNDKKPVCEYYRAKGRCFKGSKCQDRHVMDSDESDDDSEDWKMMDQMHYLDDSFERELIIGSVIGMRVSAIYTAGVFYGYLTHDITGFIDDGQTYYDDDSDVEDDEGLEFKTIQDMEAHLREFLKFQQISIDKRFDLPVNTMVAVSDSDDIVHRGSVRKMVSDTHYQVFLVDYGVPVEANVNNLSLLPNKYLSKYKQQCFMCKLHGVTITEQQSIPFADWLFDRVNRKVLHCRVVDTDMDGTNYVELYNFNDSNNSDTDINMAAKKLFQS